MDVSLKSLQKSYMQNSENSIAFNFELIKIKVDFSRYAPLMTQLIEELICPIGHRQNLD